jgi:hypothetical protein
MKRVFGNFALLRRPDAARFAMGFTEEMMHAHRAAATADGGHCSANLADSAQMFRPSDHRGQHARTLPPSLMDPVPDNPCGGWFVVKNVTEANGRIDVHGNCRQGPRVSVLPPAAP